MVWVTTALNAITFVPGRPSGNDLIELNGFSFNYGSHPKFRASIRGKEGRKVMYIEGLVPGVSKRRGD